MAKKRHTQITRNDLSDLSISSLESQLAQSRSEIAELRRHICELVHQLDVYKLQEMHTRKKRESEGVARVAKDEVDAAYDKQRNLAAVLAKRYNFDTKTSSIDLVTGEILPL